MNHPKTEPKAKKPTVHLHPRHESPPAPAPARQPNASNALIEACDRLGQKLDEFAGVIREQTEAWRQIHPPGAPRPVPREEPRGPAPLAPTEPRALSENPPAAPPETLGAADPMPALAARANNIIDSLGHANAGGGQEQAEAVQRALDGIMEYLENQAAITPLKIDVDAIMSRLLDLEQRQSTLQSQLNNNRWGPA